MVLTNEQEKEKASKEQDLKNIDAYFQVHFKNCARKQKLTKIKMMLTEELADDIISKYE